MSLITLQSAAADVVRLAILDGIAAGGGSEHAGRDVWCVRRAEYATMAGFNCDLIGP